MEILNFLLDIKFLTLLFIYIATFCGVENYFYKLVENWSSNFFFLTIGIIISLTLATILSKNNTNVNLTYIILDNSLALVFILIIMFKSKMNLSQWRNYVESSFGSFLTGILATIHSYNLN